MVLLRVILCTWEYAEISWLTNSVPLSDRTSFGAPNLLVISCKCPTIVRASADAMGKAFGHLVRYSTNTKMYLFCLLMTGSGPITSTPHLSKMLCGSMIGCRGA